MSDAISLRHGPFGRVGLYRLNRPFVTHAHREAHLFFYVSGTTGIMRVSGKALTVDPTRAVAISPWEPHSFEPVPSGNAALYLVLYIRPEWFASHEGIDEDFRFGENMITLTPGTAHWVQRMGDLLIANDDGHDVDLCLYETTSRCYDLSWRHRRWERGDKKPLDRRIQRSLGIMDELYQSDLEMDWLARESCLSRPHFFKLFKQQMGVTPNIYLNTLRSEHAINDLLETPKSVTEIGYDLGFSSQASFTRFFAANVGVAPSEYRKVALLA